MTAPPTLIVGAGPAGLAVARCLQTRGVEFLVVEGSDSVGHTWRNHYERLRLHTVREQSGLPDQPMPHAWPRYVSRDQVVEYLDDYARRFDIAPRFGCEVSVIERAGDRWHSRLSGNGTIESTNVVIATGMNRVPHSPDWPGLADTALPVMHSREYRTGEALAGKRVLVVGMGNTGAEIALDLLEHGARPAISVRGPVNIVYRDTLGRPIQLTAIALETLPARIAGPVGRLLQGISVGDLERWGIRRPTLSPGQQLRTTGKTPTIDVGTIARIKKGEIPVLGGIRSIGRRSVELEDGSEHSFDRVILATGYRPHLEQLVPDASAMLDERGYPRELWGSGPLSGLYFLGFNAYDAGGVLRRIRMDSARIADHIRDTPDG